MESPKSLKSLKERLWGKVMEVGPSVEKGSVHYMPESTITSLIRSVPDDVGHNNSNFQIQLGWDVTHFKYKLFDEIGMLLTDRTKGYEGQTPELERETETWAVELAKDFLGCTTLAKDQSELYHCVEERQTARSLGKAIKDDGVSVFSDKKFNFSANEVLRGMI